MIDETMNKAPLLGQLIEQYLDSITLFTADPNQAVNTQRGVLRVLFRPLILYLFEQGQILKPNEVNSPEAIINAILAIPGIQLEADLVRLLKEKYSPSAGLDWLEETTKISLEGNQHPIDQLSQLVIGKMSPQGKKILIQCELGLSI